MKIKEFKKLLAPYAAKNPDGDVYATSKSEKYFYMFLRAVKKDYGIVLEASDATHMPPLTAKDLYNMVNKEKDGTPVIVAILDDGDGFNVLDINGDENPDTGNDIYIIFQDC